MNEFYILLSISWNVVSFTSVCRKVKKGVEGGGWAVELRRITDFSDVHGERSAC